ncbi:MAG: hypothetical protein JWL95_2876 [Gemmatimonadetes bacterium]|nr:hypothetical protein [Gemmatimonadota bacterium]
MLEQSVVKGPVFASRQRIAACSLLLVLGCKGDAPPATTPPLDVAAPAPSVAPLSRFSVPLEYDVTAVLRVVDQVVPRTFGSMDSVRTIGDDTRKHYAFAATRGPFTAFASGQEMHLRATLAYSARGYFKPPIGPTISAGCGEGDVRPRIVVELATPLSLTPDWHLVSHARLVTIRPASTEGRDRCDVGILHTDVTDRVVGAARAALTSHLRNIDRKVGTVDLTSRVNDWWAMLARPIPLSDGVWLALQPEQLRMGRVSGEAKVLTVPVTLDARPRIVTGVQPPEVSTGGPPPLAKDTVVDGFRIALDGLVDYGTGTRALTDALAHRKLTRAGRTVTVQEVTVLPASRGRLLLSVSFAGDASGRLQLIGTPHYDARRQEVSVPDLDYDLETKSTIVNAYEWLRSDELRTMLREKAHLPAAPALAKGRELLLSGLNRKLGDAVTLSATVDSVAVKGVFVTREGVMLRAEATGQARVAVKQQ